NIKTKSLIKVNDKAIQEPLVNAPGTKVAYILDNNVFVIDVTNKKTIQVTTDGSKNKIINGITDWVYEEEVRFVRAFDLNNDGTQLAVIKFDESDLPVFSMDVYVEDLYPSQQFFIYPKAGENNAKFSLHLYNTTTKATKNVALNSTDHYYIPRIKFT